MLLNVYIVVIVTVVLVADVTAQGRDNAEERGPSQRGRTGGRGGRRGNGRGGQSSSSSSESASSESSSSEKSSSEEQENWYDNLKYQDLLDIVCSDNFKNLMTEPGCKFEVDRIPEMRTFIPSMPSIDVGTCPFGSCSTRPYCTDGYICSQTETRVADFELLGSVEYEYVTKCGCCKDEGIKVMVYVFDSDTREPVADVNIKINTISKGVTDDHGFLESWIETSAQIVITAIPDYESHHDALRVVDIAPNSRGPVEVKLYVVKMAEFVEILPGNPFTFDLSPSSGSASIVIRAEDSFQYVNKPGKPTGPVYASITFLDSNVVNEELLPGRFLDDAGRPLISQGVMSLYFKDVNDEELKVDSFVLWVDSGMVPWTLNPVTGFWTLANTLNVRRKRQISQTDFLMNIGNHVWINIDQLNTAPLCFFKARIFNEASENEITSSLTATFKPEILAYTNDDKRLRMTLPSTNSPGDTCFEYRCPDNTFPSYPMVGYMNMSSTETVYIDGVNVPYKAYLQPLNLQDYSPAIQAEHSNIRYEISQENGRDIFVNFFSNADGPFYSNRGDCESSTETQPAFHFYKAPLPNQQSAPTGISTCFARIVFKDSGTFYDYISTLGNLPSVTGVSTWTNYIYLNTAQLQTPTDGSDIVSACLEYRCSALNEQTTVYLDIAVPEITLSNDEVNPAFKCTGSCGGTFCNNQDNPDINNSNNNVVFNASFVAPEDIDQRPGFFDLLPECVEATSPDQFAYTFQCSTPEDDTSLQ